ILNLRGESLSRSTIELMWEPPSKPNGPITTYLVYYAPIDDCLPVNNSKFLCLMKDRWRSEEDVSMDNLNLNQSTRCSRPKNHPLFIRSELKDTIINDLDHYFEDKSSTFNDQYKSDSQEQSVVEHKPYINEYNRSISDTRVLIEGLKDAQMYMFEVFECHNISKQPLSDTCSLNEIILAIRTKPASRDLVRNVQLIVPVQHSDYLAANIKSHNYHIS
ncbi:unnamed protein product, partial [Rotaria sp. Silwood2]